MKLSHVALASLVVAATVTAASAQSGGMKLHVYDAKNNESLPGAVVVLSHATGNVKTTTEQTDLDGNVVFPVLRAGGGYIVEVSFPGYAKVRLADQRVKIGESVSIPIGLSEAIQEKVEVVGRREVVDLERTETATRFSEEFVKDLPVQGRFYQNVLSLAPGVSDDDGDGNVNVHGSRSTDFKTTVGGVSNVDPLTGEWLSNVNPDSIEEIEVVTAGAGVEFGRAQGGYAQIVQKQGSNDREGQVSLVYASSKLDGNGATNLTGKRFPAYDTYIPGVQFSGPILKDRLWYILSYEFHSVETPVNITSGVVVQTQRQPIASGTLTWQASPRNKLALTYRYDSNTRTNIGVSSIRPVENAVRTEVGGPTMQVEWQAPYSPKLLVTSMVAYQDPVSNILPMTDSAEVNNNCVLDFPELQIASCRNLIDNSFSGAFNLTHRDKRQRLTLKSDLEFFGGRIWGMTHQFKFGFISENERFYQEEVRNPNIFLYEVQGVGDNDFAKAKQLQGQFTVPQTEAARATGNTWGFYAKDQFKPVNNLSLEVGVRLDREQLSGRGYQPFDPEAEAQLFFGLTNPPPLGASQDPVNAVKRAFTAYEGAAQFSQEIGKALGIPPDLATQLGDGIVQQSAGWAKQRRLDDLNVVNTNFSPFLSASWDPWSNSKTKFSASAGRYYGFLPLNIPALELAPASAFITIDLTNDGRPVGGDVQQSVRSLNAAPNVTVVDRNIQTPYTDEFTFTFERQLAMETTLKLTYVRRKIRDQVQDIDLNHLPADYGFCVLQRTLKGATIQQAEPKSAKNPTGGDGELDDCIGRLVLGPREPGSDPGDESNLTNLNRPDDFLDTYVQNPAWGSLLLVGNFNSTDYRGVVLELDRRQYKGWELQGSYTWSEAIGDAESFDSLLGDDRTTLTDERGYLDYDQRHVVKVNATTVTPWGIRVGGTVQWSSGYPYSITDLRATRDAIPEAYKDLEPADPTRTRLLYPSHQRNDQRNESWWNFNVRLAKDWNLKGGRNLQASAEVFNLLNADTLNIEGVTVSGARPAATRDTGRKFQLQGKYSF